MEFSAKIENQFSHSKEQMGREPSKRKSAKIERLDQVKQITKVYWYTIPYLHPVWPDKNRQMSVKVAQ